MRWLRVLLAAALALAWTAAPAQQVRPGFAPGSRFGFQFLGSAAAVVPYLPTPGFDATGALGWWDFNKTAGDGSALNFYNSIGSANGGSTTVAYATDLLGNGYDMGQGNKDYQPTKGPNNGAQFDTTLAGLQIYRTTMLSGLSQFSLCMKVRPLVSTASRSIFNALSAVSTVSAVSAAPAAVGTGYLVGDYITFANNVSLLVNAVDGNGGVTSVSVATPGAVATAPTQPQTQTATNTPSTGTAGAGTGATFNITYTVKPSTTVRFNLLVSAGSTTRKLYSTGIAVQDGAANSTSTTNGTSLGAPNGAAQTDTTTLVVFCEEVDLAAGTVSFYRNGTLDGTTQTITPAETPKTFNTSPSTAIVVGNNLTIGTAPAMVELMSMVAFNRVLNATQNASVAAGL